MASKADHWQLAGRGTTALVGGYGIAALYAFVVGRLLPLPPVDASLVATMASFVIYTLVAIWSFAAATLQRAITGLGVATVVALSILLAAQALAK